MEYKWNILLMGKHVICLGIILLLFLLFIRAPYLNHSVTRDQTKQGSVPLFVVMQPWQPLLMQPFQLLLVQKADCWSGSISTSREVSFCIGFCKGFGSLLCFVLIRCLVSKQLLIQCCNSVTEDNSIVFLVLYVAVFNKP